MKLLFHFLCFLPLSSLAFAADKPHLAFVVGTHHYSPQVSMPLLAKEMEKFGFRTTVVMPEGDPEKKETVPWTPGIEVLDDADVAVFFMRFLTIGDAQWAPIERYIESGKPVVAFRTSTHAFIYPKDHPRFSWNDDFGEKLQGTAYRVHMSGETECALVEKHSKHPILTGVAEGPFISPGTLYLTDLEAGCVPLVFGTGSTGKAGIREGGFGTMYLQKDEADILAWAWEKNAFGARAFATSFGHVGDFAVPQITRIIVNGIHWAAGKDVPAADAEVSTWVIADPRKKKRK